MDEVQQFLVKAEKFGYTNPRVIYDENGQPKIRFTRMQGANAGIDRQIREMKPQLITRLNPTPAKSRATAARSATLPWLGRLNKAINSRVEPDPAKHPYLHALYPESASGKALMAVPAILGAAGALPETILGATALGAGTSVGTGYGAGEIQNGGDIASHAIEGGLSLGLPEALGKISGLKTLMRGRHELIADLDSKAQGEYVGKALGLDRLSGMLNRGRSWVAGLRDARVQGDAWNKLSAEQESIYHDLQMKVQGQVDNMKQAFRKKWGLNANGRAPLAMRKELRTSKEMLKEFHDLTAQVRRMAKIPRDYRANITKLKVLGKKGWDKGEFKHTVGGIEAAETYEDVMNGLRNTLSGQNAGLPFNDPELLQRFDEARKAYKHYAAFRDLADNPKMLTTDPTGSGLPSGKINTRELQLMLRDEPRNYQSRLGDLWDDFKLVVNRGEIDPERVDVQANVPSLRNVSGHLSAGGSPRGFIRNAVPLRGKYVGNQVERLPKLFSNATKTRELLKAPPALIIGGGALGGKGADFIASEPEDIRNAP